MFTAVIITYKGLAIFISSNFATIISIGVGAIVYSVMVIALKIMTADELEKLPKGAKLAKLVRKIQK